MSRVQEMRKLLGEDEAGDAKAKAKEAAKAKAKEAKANAGRPEFEAIDAAVHALGAAFKAHGEAAMKFLKANGGHSAHSDSAFLTKLAQFIKDNGRHFY